MVVCCATATAGCEVLLVRRNAQLAFHGGAWVFPGGRIDPADRTGCPTTPTISLQCRAAARRCREALEEAGVADRSGQLVHLSRWVTPEGTAEALRRVVLRRAGR